MASSSYLALLGALVIPRAVYFIATSYPFTGEHDYNYTFQARATGCRLSNTGDWAEATTIIVHVTRYYHFNLQVSRSDGYVTCFPLRLLLDRMAHLVHLLLVLLILCPHFVVSTQRRPCRPGSACRCIMTGRLGQRDGSTWQMRLRAIRLSKSPDSSVKLFSVLLCPGWRERSVSDAGLVNRWEVLGRPNDKVLRSLFRISSPNTTSAQR